MSRVCPKRIAAAYAELEGRQLWRKPIPVYLTPRGRIILGETKAPPARAMEVCRYMRPIPSLDEFTGDIEHVAELLDIEPESPAEQPPACNGTKARVLAAVRTSRVAISTTCVAAVAGCHDRTARIMLDRLWQERQIGRVRRRTGERGPLCAHWTSSPAPTAARPVSLPTGPNAPARCAGRRPVPGAKACAIRETCARYRALLDTWNTLTDAERHATTVHAHMCEHEDGHPHYLELPETNP
jgi:hypothetical protein